MTNATRLVKHGLGYLRASNVNPQGVGFPDLVLVHPRRGLIFAELKRDLGPRGGSSDHQVTTPEQDAWLADLRSVEKDLEGLREEHNGWHSPMVNVYVWRPADLNAIAKALGI